VLHRYDEEDLYSPSALSFVPHLAHLVLRDVECGIIIRTLVMSDDVKNNFNIHKLLEVLSRIIDTQFIDPNLKARALAIRVMERCRWNWGEVRDLDGNLASEEIKQRSMQEIQEAFIIAQESSIANKALLMKVVYAVQKGLGSSTDDCWNKVCTEAKCVKSQDDVYFALNFLGARINRAIRNKDAKAIQSCLKELSKKRNSGGECWKLLDELYTEKITPLLQSPAFKTQLEKSGLQAKPLVSPGPVVQAPITTVPPVFSKNIVPSPQPQITPPVSSTEKQVAPSQKPTLRVVNPPTSKPANPKPPSDGDIIAQEIKREVIRSAVMSMFWN
jgi:hypothetical protein